MSLCWQPLSLGGSGPQFPKGRWGHTMTVVTSSHLVIFGGLSGGRMYNDVHIFEIGASRASLRAKAPRPPRLPGLVRAAGARADTPRHAT